SFAVYGLFSALAGTLLAGTLGHSSRALAGGMIAIVFGTGVAFTLATTRWAPRRHLASGMATVVLGLALVVLAAWAPSLTLFIIGGALVGAGAGSMFKGALGTVISVAAPEGRAEAVAGLFLASYVGLSIPVIALGVALQELDAKVALLGFATLA